MSTIKVRKLDNYRDPVFGGGKNDYVTDIDAVAQIIQSRLLFFKGEWWEDLEDGLPMWQSILGASGNNKKLVDAMIQKQVLDTPYVNGIDSVDSSFDPESRSYVFSAVVNTEFGQLQITG